MVSSLLGSHTWASLDIPGFCLEKSLHFPPTAKVLGDSREGLKHSACCSEREAPKKQRTVGTQGAGGRSREWLFGDSEL